MSALSFLLVGTPRSGTTLTQRICCEVPDVVMPPETHFLQRFAPELMARSTWPLGRDEVAEELERFLALPTSTGLELDPEHVLELVGDRCPSVLELFDAVVAALVGAVEGDILGEKTPEHLLWWRVMTRFSPGLRLIGVVRDPRAVAVSHRNVPWGIKSARELAEEWAFEQRQLLLARRSLGPERCLVLRYEDIVRDPQGARSRIGRFLAAADRDAEVERERPTAIVHDWEWWKQKAAGPVIAEGLGSWRHELSEEEADQVVGLAGREMAKLGYLEAEQVPQAGRKDDEVRRRLARRLARIRRLGEQIERPGYSPTAS